MPVSVKDLALVMPLLDKQEAAVLFRSVLGIRTAERAADVPVVDRLKAGLWEFCVGVGFVSDGQRRALLARMGPALEDLAGRLAGDPPVFELTFVEQRWAAWPLRTAWYDVVYDEDVERLPEPGVLKVVCDVTAMFLRQEAWLKRLGGDDAGREHHAQGGQPGGAGVGGTRRP